MKAFTVLAWFITLSTLACAPIPPAEYPAPQPMIVPAPVASVWPAVIDVITERQLSIKTVDRASGFVQTEILQSKSSEWWDCGKRETITSDVYVDIASTEGVYAIITISAVPRGRDSTQVRVAADPRVANYSGAPCNSKGVFELELTRQIRERWGSLRARP